MVGVNSDSGVLIETNMMITTFWVATSCCLVDRYQYFGGTKISLMVYDMHEKDHL
jgi:hypothetical protein